MLGSLGDLRHISNAEVLAALKAEFRDRYEVAKGRIPADLVEEARTIANEYLPSHKEE